VPGNFEILQITAATGDQRVLLASLNPDIPPENVELYTERVACWALIEQWETELDEDGHVQMTIDGKMRWVVGVIATDSDWAHVCLREPLEHNGIEFVAYLHEDETWDYTTKYHDEAVRLLRAAQARYRERRAHIDALTRRETPPTPAPG